MGRSGLSVALAAWLGATAIGVALVALLPENWLGEGRLFSLSAAHGPTPSDAVGLVIILAGWAAWLRALWVRRRLMRPPGAAALLALASALAIVGCLVAVAAGWDGLAVLLGVCAFTGQVALGGMTR